MRMTDWTRDALRHQRFRRDMQARGYEEIGEGGGRLWELYRGSRTNHKITDAIVSSSGKSVFVKIEKAI